MGGIKAEIVCNVMAKARVLGIKGNLVTPGKPTQPSVVEWAQALAEYQENFSYLEFKKLIVDGVSDQQKKTLTKFCYSNKQQLIY